MIYIACENPLDEVWLSQLLSRQKLAAAPGGKPANCPVTVDSFGNVRAPGQLISCGLDRKATVTVSSLLQPGGMAALQREIYTLDGHLLRPRELSLKGLPGNLSKRLTGAGLLLLLGLEG